MTEREDGVRNEPVSIVFEEKAQRSAAYQDGRLIGECEFSASETVWIITHTSVRSGHEGQGIARKPAEKVIGAGSDARPPAFSGIYALFR